MWQRLKEVRFVPSVDAVYLRSYFKFIFIINHEKYKQQYILRL